MSADAAVDELDRPRTLKEAAALTGLPYFKLQRSVKAGLLPSYQLLNGRKYVKLRDIWERMAAA